MYKEMAFIAYHFHWAREEILTLSHLERARWCYEISYVNKELSGEEENIFGDFM